MASPNDDLHVVAAVAASQLTENSNAFALNDEMPPVYEEYLMLIVVQLHVVWSSYATLSLM